MDSGGILSGVVTLLGNASIGGSSGAGQISSPVGDGGAGYGITKVGASLLTLPATNTYSGSTIVNAGTLALGPNGSFSNSARIMVNGGTLDVSAPGSFTLSPAQPLSLGGGLFKAGH